MLGTDEIRVAAEEANTRFLRGDAYAASELETALAADYPSLYVMVRSREYRKDILANMLREMDAVREGADPRRAEERVGRRMAEIYVYPQIKEEPPSSKRPRSS